MRQITSPTKRWILLSTILASLLPVALQGWGEQGHRLVANLAAKHLTPIARQNVAWLLDNRPLADIASWADEFRGDNNQTEWWHFMNIPPAASGYDRDRDCPRQNGVEAGSRGDRWRDCIVDRILYNQERLANTTLDRPDRAIALKYVVHFIGDLHQPFHTLGIGRGGNDVHVTVFGSSNCSNNPSREFPCNLHSVWDSMLITHRGWNDQQWITAAESLATRRGLFAANPGTPADWGNESFQLAKAAIVPDQGTIDEAYYAKYIGTIEERIALAGARLAAVLNKSLHDTSTIIDSRFPTPDYDTGMNPKSAALTFGCCIAISLFSGAVSASLSARSTMKDETMTTIAKGEFDVKLVPQPSEDKSEGAPMGRMTIDKVFHGDLDGTSKGEMLTAMSPAIKDSGVYVAVERVSGSLNGRKGTFALHHTGIMDRGQQNLTVTIVPDSGTGELTGIRGTMKIIIDGKKHFYELDYAIKH